MLINRNFMSEKINNFKKALEEKGLLTAIKSAFNEHVANAPVEPAPIVEAPVALAADVVLKDGTKVAYEGEKLDIGVAVKMLNADGSSAEMLDGEYVMADDSKLYVKGGLVEKIEAVTAAPIEEPVMDMAAKVAALELAVTELKNDKNKAKETMLSRLEAIEKLSKSTHEGLKTSLSAIDAIIETPAAEPIVGKVKAYEEMSNHEKMLFNKGKL